MYRHVKGSRSWQEGVWLSTAGQRGAGFGGSAGCGLVPGFRRNRPEPDQTGAGQFRGRTAGAQAERLSGAASGGPQGCRHRHPHACAKEQGLRGERGQCFQRVSEMKGLWRGNPLNGRLPENSGHCLLLRRPARDRGHCRQSPVAAQQWMAPSRHHLSSWAHTDHCPCHPHLPSARWPRYVWHPSPAIHWAGRGWGWNRTCFGITQ